MTHYILISQGEKKLMSEMPVKPDRKSFPAFDYGCDCKQCDERSLVWGELEDAYESALQLAKEKAILIDDVHLLVEKLMYGQTGMKDGLPYNYYQWKDELKEKGDHIMAITTDKVFVEVRQYYSPASCVWYDTINPYPLTGVDYRTICRLVDRKPETKTEEK